MARPTLLVLAAGMGSRYGGLKQMDPVGPGGEWIIDYSVYDAIRAGFGKVVFVIRREMAELFRESVGSRFEGRIPVEYVFQELDDLPSPFSVPEGREKPWGTGHAVLRGAEKIAEPFAAINADDFYGQDAYRQLGAWLSALEDPKAGEFAMVGYRLDKTLSPHGSVSRGICETDDTGSLIKVVERTQIERLDDWGIVVKDSGRDESLTGQETVSLNMWGFSPVFFEQLKERFVQFLGERGQEPKSEFYLPFAVDQLVSAGEARVKVLRTDDAWYGVTYPQDKPEVVAGIRRLIDAGVYPEKLWAEAPV